MDDKSQDLVSPHVTRGSSAASNATMEVISDSWFEGKNNEVDSGGGWGPPVVQRRGNAWEDPEPVKLTYGSHKELQTEKWVKTSTTAPQKPKESQHPVSQGTQDFLASLVDDMREGGSSNTTVMSLLSKPVSVFDEPSSSRDLDVNEQEKINQELEGFLKQIREIRDGPPQPAIEGPVASEIEAHLTEQKTAVEEALAALDRELTQDSGVNSSEAEHEEEFKRIITRESTMTSEGTDRVSDHVSESDQITRSNTQCTMTSQHTDATTEPAAEQPSEPLVPNKLKKMGLYELLALHPDAKVRKAALKMKRLDAQLKLVIQKEREVKKQHELLNKQILLYNSGAELIKTNQSQEEADDDLTEITDLKSEVTPIFATQLLDGESDTCSLPPISTTDSVTSRNNTPRDKTRGKSRETSRGGSRGYAGSQRGRRTATTSKQSNFSKKEDKKRVNNKNFIARNKELANDASAVIAMTEEEKQRLNELLCDLDTVNEDKIEGTVVVVDDGGFKASADEDRRLREIESLLIMEEGSAMSICSGNTNNTLLSLQSTAVAELDSKCGKEEIEKLGETALKSLSEKRSEEERLNLIDEMLAKLTCQDQEELPEVPRSVLDELLIQCRAESAKLGSEDEIVSVS